MLCCSQCFRGELDDEPNTKSPLLIGIPSATKLVKRSPASARTQRRKLNKPSDDESLRKIQIEQTKVKNVDKRMKDHGDLYNDYFEKFKTIDKHMTALYEAYPAENEERSLVKTMELIKLKTGGEITVQRKQKYYMQMYCDDDYDDNLTIDYVQTFNDVNTLIKDTMEKGPSLKNSITLVLKDEREFRRDVLAASLGADGPDCMKNCIEGITELKLVPNYIDEIMNETRKIFDERLLQATKSVCLEKISRQKVERLIDASLSMNTDDSSD